MEQTAQLQTTVVAITGLWRNIYESLPYPKIKARKTSKESWTPEERAAIRPQQWCVLSLSLDAKRDKQYPGGLRFALHVPINFARSHEAKVIVFEYRRGYKPPKERMRRSDRKNHNGPIGCVARS